jgi:hypothetical protein
MAAQAAGMEVDRVRLAQSYPDPVLWYYTGPLAHLVLPPAADDDAGARREVAGLAEAGVERVVLAVQPDGSWDERGIAQTALTEQYALAASQNVAAWQVETYVRPPADDAPEQVSARFGNGVVLEEASIQNDGLEPGALLTVYLTWGGDPGGASGSEKLTVQLLDEAGVLVAQTDAPFAKGGQAGGMAGLAQPYVIQLPWSLPNGKYRVIAALYDPAQDTAPRILTAEGADHVVLGTLDAR